MYFSVIKFMFRILWTHFYRIILCKIQTTEIECSIHFNRYTLQCGEVEIMAR